MGEKPSRLKVHRYAVTLDGTPVTMLRLRPGETELFATNYFHRVWHILSDESGVRLLGRLCWALSYQRRPGTLFVLDRPELVANPFDADPSNTIVLRNPNLGPFNAAMARSLSRLLRRPASPDGTVGLQTPGLDIALADPAAFRQEDDQAGWLYPEQTRRVAIERVNALLVFSAPAPVWRSWAVGLTKLGDPSWPTSDCFEFDYYPSYSGEVQLISDFPEKVARAQVARDRLFAGRGHEELSPEERAIIWEAADSQLFPEGQ